MTGGERRGKASVYGRLWRGPMVSLLFWVLAVASSPASADTPRWRGLFQERCGACHATAGPLVRETLELVEGDLRRRQGGGDLRAFLPRHVRRLSVEEVELIHRELARIAAGQGQFVEHCGLCHGSAEGLARLHLILRGERLVGRYSGRDIANFLLDHGRLDPEGAAFFTGILRRHTSARDRTEP